MPGALGQSPAVLHPIALHSVASVGRPCEARPCYEAPPLPCIVLPLYWISQYVGLQCILAAGHCFTLHCVRLACIRHRQKISHGIIFASPTLSPRISLVRKTPAAYYVHPKRKFKVMMSAQHCTL